MKDMNRLFVIHTPYQLMCAINIIKCTEECHNTLLLVQPILEQYHVLCKQLSNTKIVFDKKLYIKYGNKGNLLVYFSILKEIILKKQIIGKCDYLSLDIDELFVPSDDIICRLVYHIFKGASRLGQIVYQCLIDNSFERNISKVYCYEPSLMAKLPAGVSIVKVISNEWTNRLFSDFAKEKTSVYKNRTVLFFDQGLSGHTEIQKCLEILRTEFEREEIIVKMHPRIMGGIYSGFDTANEGLPFEAIMPLFDLDRTIFVSHSSGACVTAYLMSKYKPFIILLAKLTNKDSEDTSVIKFLKKMQKTIIDNRVYLPNSTKEFQDILFAFRNK